MALESEANFKTAIGTAAADLTTALQDTVLTEMAAIVRDSKHPLRQIDKLFNLDPATGVFTSDDTYIAAAYAGNPLIKGDTAGVSAPLALTLISAMVEDAAPLNIVLTFNRPIREHNLITLGGEAKTVDTITISGAVVTIAVTVPYQFGNTISVATGNFQDFTQSLLTLTTESVTNNLAVVTVSSMTVEDAAPTDVVIVFDEVVTGTNLGFTIAGTTSTVFASISGSGTNTITGVLAVAVANGESPTLAYDEPTGDIKDLSLDVLATFAATAITNNVAP